MTPGAAAYPELFNDVFGPVMQPGSSSHTAAPCRLGRLAGDLLGEPAAAIRIQLDERGSFAGTFGVMSEDRAMVAGVLGLGPDDVGLFRAFELAAEAGATVAFEFTHLTESDHPNAMKFVLTGRSGRRVTLVGTSTGGGMVETIAVDGFALRTIGDAYVVLVFEPDPASGSALAASARPRLRRCARRAPRRSAARRGRDDRGRRPRVAAACTPSASPPSPTRGRWPPRWRLPATARAWPCCGPCCPSCGAPTAPPSCSTP